MTLTGELTNKIYKRVIISSNKRCNVAIFKNLILFKNKIMIFAEKIFVFT